MTLSATRLGALVRLRSDAAGAVSSELAAIVALVCLAAVGAWATLGSNVEIAVRCAAEEIAAGTSGNCRSGAGDDDSARSPPGVRIEDEGTPDEVSPIAIVEHDAEAFRAIAAYDGSDAVANVVHFECTEAEIAGGTCRRPGPQPCDWLDLACLARQAGEAVGRTGAAVVEGAQTVAGIVGGILIDAGRGVGLVPGEISEPSFSAVPGTSGATLVPVDGPLYAPGNADAGSIDPNDVAQGGIVDCYVMSAFAAVARQSPELVSRAIRVNADGSYTVTLYRENGRGGFDPVPIVVTNKLPVRPDGSYLFAQPGDSTSDGKPELWPMILEKAYAQLEGGYDAMRKGGHPAAPLSALTGEASVRIAPSELTFEQIAGLYESGSAITMGTLVDADAKNHPLFQDSTLAAWHVYYVRGVDAASRTITITNPYGWGTDEVTLTFEQFQSVTTGVTASPTRVLPAQT